MIQHFCMTTDKLYRPSWRGEKQEVGNDKISVIIPVHNGSKYIQKTVNGILHQNYPILFCRPIVNLGGVSAFIWGRVLAISRGNWTCAGNGCYNEYNRRSDSKSEFAEN